MAELLTIGKAAAASGLSPKTVRFYEETGLLPGPQRTDSGYRLYTATDVRRLRLVRRAKILGLSLKEIKELAELAFDESCGAFEERLHEVVGRRLTEIERTIDDLQSLRTELLELRHTLADGGRSASTCTTDDCEFCRFVGEEDVRTARRSLNLGEVDIKARSS